MLQLILMNVSYNNIYIKKEVISIIPSEGEVSQIFKNKYSCFYNFLSVGFSWIDVILRVFLSIEDKTKNQSLKNKHVFKMSLRLCLQSFNA